MLRGTRFRPEIADLMAAMTRHGVTPVVITASHVDLVHGVLRRHYAYGETPLAGMVPVLKGGAYGGELTVPATFRPGKVDAARAIARALTGDEDARPVFCAGDTNTDLEMVAYSSAYRLFFDRGKRPFMDLAGHLAAHGAGATTLVQPPF
jgi:phosphoserine phosphatase